MVGLSGLFSAEDWCLGGVNPRLTLHAKTQRSAEKNVWDFALVCLTENSVAREIVDAAYRVHTRLGPGLLESVYETALDRVGATEARTSRFPPTRDRCDL